jgi:aspartate kinase
MKVFKFGGASIKDAEAIRNMANIILQYQDSSLLIVVSAMGKTTNALEEVLRLKDDPAKAMKQIDRLQEYHLDIAHTLFFPDHPVTFTLIAIIDKIRDLYHKIMPYNEWYDQIVSCGEIMSSRLVHAWLMEVGISTHWLDARSCILTDDHFREGQVHWDQTFKNIQEQVIPVLNDRIVLTQGFIGGTNDGRTTTLGREGSDFSAAIFAACLQAESLTVWKDVDGIMNADPKRIPDTIKLDTIPYKEAAEMTYYGASVIHPKTIKPLANAHIPLYVRSFYHPERSGTAITDSPAYEPVPAIIMKDDQCLVSFHVRDFTFINEQNLSLIFHQLAEMDMKINIMQNSAISFSICVDYDQKKLDDLMSRLKGHFTIRFNTGLLLITVKNYTPDYLSAYKDAYEILLEQITRNTYRVLLHPERLVR